MQIRLFDQIKPAEDGNGTILRLFNPHTCPTTQAIALSANSKKLTETNLLELEEELSVKEACTNP